MENFKMIFVNDIILIVSALLVVSLVLTIRAILKFSAKKGTSFFKSIPAYFAYKKDKKATKIEDDLIEEGLKADRIAAAKKENYQGTDELQYFYSVRKSAMLKKKVKSNKKNK